MEKITAKQVEIAWKEWQSEESRDRGYNFQLCQALKKNYQLLQQIYDEQNKGETK